MGRASHNGAPRRAAAAAPRRAAARAPARSAWIALNICCCSPLNPNALAYSFKTDYQPGGVAPEAPSAIAIGDDWDLWTPKVRRSYASFEVYYV